MSKARKTEEEISREIVNKAWAMFNRYLNMDIEWKEARECSLDEVSLLSTEFHRNYKTDPDNKEKSEAEWKIKMKRFEQLKTAIRNIPT